MDNKAWLIKIIADALEKYGEYRPKDAEAVVKILRS